MSSTNSSAISQSSNIVMGQNALPTNGITPSLYVGDLAPDITEATLLELFRKCGVVASVRVCRDSVTRRSLGYAYVNFHRLEDAERALDTMNYENIKGRPCRIMWSQRDPSLRRKGTGNICVKNLDPKIDSKQLYDTFSIFGNILSSKVATNRETGESLGYGFVHYASDEAAQKAITKVNNKTILNRKVIVEPYKNKSERGSTETTFTNVYVRNLPINYTEEALTTFFSKYGTITSAVLKEKTLKLKKTDINEEGEEVPIELKSKFAFINYESPEVALQVVNECNDIEIDGKKILVTKALKKEDREKVLKEKAEQAKLEKQRKYAGVNLYVRNFSDDIDDDALRELFNEFGNVTACKVMKGEDGKIKILVLYVFHHLMKLLKQLHKIMVKWLMVNHYM